MNTDKLNDVAVVLGLCEEAEQGAQERDDLFPYLDQDFVPVADPLVIARPHRFANKRELADLARISAGRLEEKNSGLLAFIIVKQWVEMLKITLDVLRERAEEDYERLCQGPTPIQGVTVSVRTVATKWKYPAEIETRQKQIDEETAALRREKKRAEEDGRAREVWKKKGLVVTFAA